jgi:hypothetical protein
MFAEMIAVYFENHNETLNIFCAQNAVFLNITAGGTYNYQCVLKS